MEPASGWSQKTRPHISSSLLIAERHTTLDTWTTGTTSRPSDLTPTVLRIRRQSCGGFALIPCFTRSQAPPAEHGVSRKALAVFVKRPCLHIWRYGDPTGRGIPKRIHSTVARSANAILNLTTQASCYGKHRAKPVSDIHAPRAN